jgi:acyl-CoA thioester hydrolase
MSASSSDGSESGSPAADSGTVGPFRCQRRAEFCETDAAGIVHFSSFVRYMEQAEHALFREIGSSVFPSDAHESRSSSSVTSPPVTWPRVHCECEYFAPVHFQEVVEVRVYVVRLGNKSITYRHEMWVGDHLVARGSLTTVCSSHVAGKLTGVPIPSAIRQSLSRYLLPNDHSTT